MADIEIRYTESEYWDSVTVFLDGGAVAGVTTAYDCPEDNNCRRLNVAGEIRALLGALGFDPQMTTEWEDE